MRRSISFKKNSSSAVSTRYYSTVACYLFASILALACCLIQSCVIYDTEQLESSLCKNKVCGNYGTCKIDENGFYAKCVCPSECSLSEMVDNDLSKNVINIPPAISARMAKSDNKISSRSYDDQIVFGVGRKSIMTVQTSKQKRRNQNNQVYELFNQVVCGSNGIDYRNFCELKKHSCKQNKQVKIYYFGKCSNKTPFIFTEQIFK